MDSVTRPAENTTSLNLHLTKVRHVEYPVACGKRNFSNMLGAEDAPKKPAVRQAKSAADRNTGLKAR